MQTKIYLVLLQMYTAFQTVFFCNTIRIVTILISKLCFCGLPTLFAKEKYFFSSSSSFQEPCICMSLSHSSTTCLDWGRGGIIHIALGQAILQWKAERWRAEGQWASCYHVPMAWGRLDPGKEFSLLLILLLLRGWVLHWNLFCKIWEWKEDTARSMHWGASQCQPWLLYPMQHCNLSVQGGLGSTWSTLVPLKNHNLGMRHQFFR